jgi:ankyrin repeat protein
VREHDLGIVWCLIKASADLSLKNGESRTPLHTAVINSNFEAARMLLQNAADASETDDDGETLLHKVFDELDEYVSMRDKKILIKLLLEKGADSCAENGRGHTPLRYAIESYCSPDDEAHRREIIDLLIAKGADLATTDKDGRTPLHWAVTGRYGTGTHWTTFEYLIQRCEVNTKDKEGDTAMHLAARYGRADLIEVLLKYDVDYLVENRNQESPCSIACDGSHSEMVSIFNQHILTVLIPEYW